MRRMTYFVMALALVLGFTQCKKEQMPANNQAEGIRITLDVNGGNSNSRVIVDPNGNNGQYNYATVNFETGDVIYVGYNNAYVGTLTYSNGTFGGTVNISETVDDEHLHFYFLGGVGFEPTVDGNTATVVISDQTQKLPVISYSPSKEVFTTTNTSYSAKLQNKISIMKFNVTTASTSAICITGMNNKVTVDFTAPSGTDNGFAYEKDGEGVIKMQGVTTENTETWAIVLPQAALEEGAEASAYTADLRYLGTRPALEEIEMNTFLNVGLDLSVSTANPHFKDLSNLPGDCVAQDGDILSGTISGDYQISIAEGATVTLMDATIAYSSNSTDIPGINCLGDATICLSGTNAVSCRARTYNGSTYSYKAGIYIPENHTLNIEGPGSLAITLPPDAEGNYGAGIGGNYGANCGNIIINGGTLEVTGGAAGIGSSNDRSCGNITINGGTVIAQGGVGCTGIGSSQYTANSNDGNTCGTITINGGTVMAEGGRYAPGIGAGYMQKISGNGIVTNNCDGVVINGGTVTAQGGEKAAGIGSGYCYSPRAQGRSTCGPILISGGTVEATGGASGAGIGTGNGNGNMNYSKCGTITIGANVIRVIATSGEGATNSIGKGSGKCSCGVVTIGDVVYWNGSAYQNGGDTYLPNSPLIYPQ